MSELDLFGMPVFYGIPEFDPFGEMGCSPWDAHLQILAYDPLHGYFLHVFRTLSARIVK